MSSSSQPLTAQSLTGGGDNKRDQIPAVPAKDCDGGVQENGGLSTRGDDNNAQQYEGEYFLAVTSEPLNDALLEAMRAWMDKIHTRCKIWQTQGTCFLVAWATHTLTCHTLAKTGSIDED